MLTAPTCTHVLCAGKPGCLLLLVVFVAGQAPSELAKGERFDPSFFPTITVSSTSRINSTVAKIGDSIIVRFEVAAPLAAPPVV
jgi:hypothetical protein